MDKDQSSDSELNIPAESQLEVLTNGNQVQGRRAWLKPAIVFLVLLALLIVFAWSDDTADNQTAGVSSWWDEMFSRNTSDDESQLTPPNHAFQNLEYFVHLPQAGARVRLTDGKFVFPNFPPESNYVELQDKFALGDLDSDGKSDAVVVLKAMQGGPYIFDELALLLATDQGYRNSQTIFLGDRVRVSDLAIENGVVRVNVITHTPQDLLSAPTAERVFRYQLTDRGLITL